MADALRIVNDLLRDIAVEQKFTNYDLQVTPISTNGANYSSTLFVGTISEGGRILNIFAKVAAMQEKMRSELPFQMYDVERFFYTKLIKVFRQLENKNNISEEQKLKVPIFYGCNENLYEETIVLEDLTKKGFSSLDRFKTVDWEYAAAAVTELAKYHALSIAYHDDDPEGFKEALEELKFEVPPDEESDKPFWDGLVGRAVDATREENKKRLETYIRANVGGKNAFMNYFAPVKVTVIGHSDFRSCNMMHRVLENGRTEVIPVDYLTLRASSLVVDLFYFIFTATDASFRARHYQQLLDHYYMELRAALARLGLDPDQKYSREDFDAEVKEKIPFGMTVAVCTLPIVTVEAEVAPKTDQDVDVNVFAIERTSSQFSERLNGIVDDFIRWGIL